MKLRALNSTLTILILSLLTYSCKESNINETASNQLEVVSSSTIIDQDDRIATKSTPFDNKITNKVGQIRSIKINSQGEKGSLSCSAAVIAKNLILTAAHCLFKDTIKGELIEDAYFYPGAMDVTTYPFGRFPVIKSYQPAAYQAQDAVEDENDFAIVELGPNSEGKHVGQFVGTLAYWGKADLEDGDATTIGYPGDKESMVQHYEKDCFVKVYSDKTLSTYCDVIKGQSGSPLLRYSQKHGFYFIFGVITSTRTYSNEASRLTKERQSIINAIKNSTFKSENFEEKWKTNKHSHSNEINLFVQNKCNKDLYVALRYKNLDGDWKSQGFHILKKGKTKNLGVTTNGVFYFAASANQGRSFINRADIVRDLEDGMGDDVHFEKVHVKKFGDYFKVYDCY
ncbi:trypsin-like serine protease [Halobacteriovorax sp. GB3]|uniref:trypsin-like serine peptidase n=1 Tax=Halobacteriovorax sp. GB3 TaxID=2719615 RepID=UPI002360FCCF|nr:trypsin-like peptidase domain-containing protein [Halobacteriovorax sp. GB3]MDD0852554.1 trypsin-like serine protease [Halobacteriovorax sp. GB3]